MRHKIPLKLQQMGSKISIIIPVFNEAEEIARTLSGLQPFRAKGHEVIVVDGGSRDETPGLSQPLSDQVIHSRRGRSCQMNDGARVATGDVFLFLHADTHLPDEADMLIVERLERDKKGWGHFHVRLSGRHPLLRLVGCLMNWRSRLTGIATGDQAMFVCRELFEKAGGFPAVDLMEDIAMSKALKKHGWPLCLKGPVKTSSRRWEKNGILRTVFLMWHLRLLYFLGLSPERLARIYEGQKSR
jgi:rSAM/selenodomain-associated transferase 2